MTGLTTLLSRSMVSMKEARMTNRSKIISAKTPILTSRDKTIPSFSMVEVSRTTSNFRRIYSGSSFSFQLVLYSKWASTSLKEVWIALENSSLQLLLPLSAIWASPAQFVARCPSTGNTRTLSISICSARIPLSFQRFYLQA